MQDDIAYRQFVQIYAANSTKCFKRPTAIFLQDPFLINGYKFDFRTYVLITSITPLFVNV